MAGIVPGRRVVDGGRQECCRQRCVRCDCQPHIMLLMPYILLLILLCLLSNTGFAVAAHVVVVAAVLSYSYRAIYFCICHDVIAVQAIVVMASQPASGTAGACGSFGCR